MNIKFKLVITTLALCLNIMARAQSDTLELTLGQAMAYATKFGYQSINAQHDIEIAKKKVRETLAIGLPQLSGSGTITNNLMLQENQIEFGDTTITTVFGTKYNNSIGGRVDQLIFDGSYLVGLKASRIYVKLSENAKELTEIGIKEAVSEAFILAVVAEKNMNDFEMLLNTNKELLKQSLAYYENGFSEDTDVDQIRLMVNQSQAEYDNSMNSTRVAMSVLKYAIGYDIDKPLKLSGDINSILAMIPLKTNTDFKVESHIDFRTIQTQIEIQHLDINNQKAQALPRLSAFLTYDLAYFGQELSDLTQTKGSMLGLNLSIPIFSSGMRSSQLKQSRIELDKLEIEKIAIEQNLKAGSFTAKSNLDNAKKQFENASLSEEISRRIFEKSLIKYKNGLLSSIDLSQVQSDLANAILNFNNSVIGYFNSYIQYQKASAQL